MRVVHGNEARRVGDATAAFVSGLVEAGRAERSVDTLVDYTSFG
jgi:hypothetical protein